MPEPKDTVSSSASNTAVAELSKTERRRIAKKRKKERLAQERLEQHQNNKKSSKHARPKKTKMTKEERKEKYTARAIERRTAKVKKSREIGMVCFRCRKKGHSAMNCPENGGTTMGLLPQAGACIKIEGKICYKCGSTEHRLADCPKRRRKTKQKIGGYQDEDLPYATCFICGEMGHLALQCEKNKKGVFVLGGSCRECGKKDHIVADCPMRKKNSIQYEAADVSSNLVCTGYGDQGDDDPGIDYEERKDDAQMKSKGKKRRKVVRF